MLSTSRVTEVRIVDQALGRRGAPRTLLRAAVRLFLGAALVVVLSGCPDPHGGFDEFTEQLAKRPPPPAGDCGEPIVQAVEGTFFAALATQLDRKAPVVMLADITTDDAGMHIVWQPLLAADRQTPVGDPIELPAAPIDADGHFSIEASNVFVDAGANPLLPGFDIAASSLGIAGFVCEDLICGDLWGQVTEPIETSLQAGLSQFAMERVEPGDAYPEPPRINCVGDLANPL